MHKIPPKIKEIISYLAFQFSNKILEREDIKQDLYVLYLDGIQRKPRLAKQKPGYFFLLFKWRIIDKLKREQKRICKEWEFIHDACSDVSSTCTKYEKFNNGTITKSRKKYKMSNFGGFELSDSHDIKFLFEDLEKQHGYEIKESTFLYLNNFNVSDICKRLSISRYKINKYLKTGIKFLKSRLGEK